MQWFLPGTLQPGERVGCAIAGRVVSGRVPAAGSADWAWTGHAQMSIQRATNGAVAAACNTALPAPRLSIGPFVIGQNGVALIRGANHLAQLEQRYGRPTTTQSSAGSCVAVWHQAALRTAFTSCAAGAVLLRATVSSPRWSSLGTVYVGDPLARVLFEAPYAKRIAMNRWRLAESHGHSLVAGLGHGRVVRLVATLG